MSFASIRRPGAPVVLLGAGLICALFTVRARAANSYFDVNGTGVGSGATTAGPFTWEGNNWNADSTGVAAPAAWADGNFALFAAGTDAAATNYTVNLASNHSIAGMALQGNGGGTVVVASTGGAVNMPTNAGGQGFFVGGVSTQNLKITAPIGGDATTPLVWGGLFSGTSTGSLYLYGNNTFQGGVTINTSAGVNINNANSFGNGGTVKWGSGTTFVIAVPNANGVFGGGDATSGFSISNPMATKAASNLIFVNSAVAPVNWTGGWTLATGISTVTTNTAGTTLTISGVVGGTDGTSALTKAGVANLLLTNTNTYAGTTTISAGSLQATEGVGLPTNFLSLNGGVYQGNGTTSFTRSLAASGTSKVQWTASGGGFSASGGKMTVNIGGASAPLVWGTTVGTQIVGPLILGSTTSNALTQFVNPIDLNNTVTAATRTVTVNGGLGGDSSELLGALSNSSAAGSLTKNGTGTLLLSGANTFTGKTTIAAGTVVASSLNKVTGGTASSSLGAPTTVANGTIGLGATTSAGTLSYNGTGETTDRVVDLAGTTAGGTIDQSGTGLLKFTSSFTATGAGAKTLTLQGSTAGTGEIAGAIVDSTGKTSVTKAGSGTWTLSGTNTYTGATTVSAGTLALGANNTIGTGSAVTVTSTLDMNGKDDSVATIAGAGNIINNNGGTGLTIVGTGNTTFSGTISGAGNFTKASTSTGTTTLSGNNSSHTGNILVQGGKLSVQNAGALGDAIGNTQISSGAELLFTGAAASVTTSEPIQISGAGGSDNGAIAVISSANPTIAGPVTLTGDSTITVSGAAGVTYSNPNAITSSSNQNLTLAGGTISTGSGGVISGAINLGAGSLTKTQGGKWVLTSSNTYSGGTIIAASGGTLLANNTVGSATGSGTVTVNGGTFGGTGAIAGAVTVNAGGTISPGASVGQFYIGTGIGPGTVALSFVGTTAALKYEIDSTYGVNLAAAADLLNSNGDLSIGAGAALNLVDVGSPSNVFAGGTKFTMISYSGTWDGGTFAGAADDSVVSVGLNQYVINYNDTTGGSNFGGGAYSNYVTLTAIPEAGPIALGSVVCIALGGVFASRRLVAKRSVG